MFVLPYLSHSHKSEIVSYCRDICEAECILFNAFQLKRFYDLNVLWLEKHYPFISASSVIQLSKMLSHQMPQLFGVGDSFYSS